MQLKVLFLVFHGFSEHNGISKKIWGQIKGFRECGADVSLCYYQVLADGRRVWVADNNVIADFGYGICAKVRKRFDYQALTEYILANDFSLVYMRSDHNANPFTIRMVRRLREGKCKVLMEIPTYPYDQEYQTWSMRIGLFVDRLYRRRLAKELNALVTFSDYNTIFGQKAIQISNGIDFDAIPLRQPILKPMNDHTIHLLAVAEVHYWHGFDRLIHGMAAYKKRGDKRVIFHLVGGLSEPRERQEILVPIEQFGLQDQVVLYGPMWGKELDSLFDLADFAIGSLGRHRTGIDMIRTLKNREYAARGIPFIYSETDKDFEKKPYTLKAVADDSPIDIQQILTFLHNASFRPIDIRNSISELSWKEQMQKVLLDNLNEK